MKLMRRCSLAAALLVCTAAAHANSAVWVDSKEYKVLMAPSQFASDPQGAANQLLQALSTRLAQLDFDKTVSGSFAAGGQDTVAYYDVAGSCTLKANNYSLRTRQGSDNDIEFKYRHPDEELSYYTDVSGAGKNASSKLETDITPSNLAYSHSTEQAPSGSGTPGSVNALISQFPGAGTLSSYGSQTLVAVNGLSIHQQEYTGPTSDIGQSDAVFTLTLWYVGASSTPSIAELSFRVDADSSKYFTTPVLQRSQILYAAMDSLSGWTLANGTEKTAWVYGYSSSAYPNGFCH